MHKWVVSTGNNIPNRKLRSAADWWRGHAGLVVSAYRILACAIGLAQSWNSSAAFLGTPHRGILAGLSLYVVITALYPPKWYLRRTGYVIIGMDLMVVTILLLGTGGLQSPFLLFTLTPLVAAALFQESRVTSGIAALSVGLVIAGEMMNPLFGHGLIVRQIGYFSIYLTAVCLVATLPYFTNANLRQQLQYEDILGERRRLSREIHDGAAQTVTAMRWQVQLLQRRLAEKGVDLSEAKDLETLAEKAQYETMESLELLRNYTGDGSFLPHLAEYVQHLKQDTRTDFGLVAKTDNFHLNPVVELQLLRICQEALTNVRRHAQASNVQVEVTPMNGRIKVSIKDDGRGFDEPPVFRAGAKGRSQGLSVMRERAESVGGKFQVFSRPGHGTEVRVEVPENGSGSNWLWQN